MEVIFAPSWWMPLMAAVIGAALLITANRRQHKRTQWIGRGILALAVAWGALAYFIDSPVEECAKKTRAMIASLDSADNKDWNKVHSLLGENTAFIVGSATVYNTRDQIVAAGKDAASTVKSVKVQSLAAHRIETQIVIDVAVQSVQDVTYGYPYQSKWQFRWQLYKDGWTLQSITCTELQGQPAEELMKRLPRK